MNLPEWFKLLGIAIVVIGLALKLRTTLVVMVAALVTGLLAGLPLFTNEGLLQAIPFLTKPVAEATTAPQGIINMLGKAFADNRLMTLFIITLPAIGLAERFGLQEAYLCRTRQPREGGASGIFTCAMAARWKPIRYRRLVTVTYGSHSSPTQAPPRV